MIPLHNGWRLSGVTGCSSPTGYGHPVITAPDGTEHGPCDLLTVTEVASLSGVEPDTIRDRIARKRLPAVKRGRDWMILVSDALAWEPKRTGPKAR